MTATAVAPFARKQAVARRVLNEHYPFKCCAVCGLQIATCLTVAHLDHNAANNAPDNLARLCQTHHWMYDAGLYPIEAVRLLQAHWQTIKGVPDHRGRMKDAGAKSAFKGYSTPTAGKFPSVLCASVNDEIVHGIPSKNRVLKNGDIISVDTAVQ